MPKLKLTKTAVEGAVPKANDYDLRDTSVPGFLLKVTPSGRKTFMLAYTAANGQRRKPAIGQFGELTVEQARRIAQDWLAEVRRGNDPSAERSAARRAPMMQELCQRFIDEYSIPRNKPSTVRQKRGTISVHILPALGRIKVSDVTRADVSSLVGRLAAIPCTANHVLCCLRKMFNMAEVWGYRPDGSNPCRHIPKYPQRGSTRLITDPEMRKLFAYLDRADAEGLEHPFLTLGIRLQFEFAARYSEILALEWSWIDFVKRRVTWPDSKTGSISKPLSTHAANLLRNAIRIEGSPYVVPSILNPEKPMPPFTYVGGWKRIVQRASIPHCGTHAVRHRAATDIANSGVPLKVGMALTAHKTVTMFMRYVHIEDEPVQEAAETVAALRQQILGQPATTSAAPKSAFAGNTRAGAVPVDRKPPPSKRKTKIRTTNLGANQAYRARGGPNRASPPGVASVAKDQEDKSSG
ncbi:tyrosine-type recombinase/integrase [Phenylobacterium montanum]|uniref:Tyrosine-type recombinase/integrase n=1 Tax=Phenylobacterium montanum TaxID=2823693 RepID=A0A975FWF6_9CAUL|nr:tyrosine-type recombinase/integrase [Caulobacter sp. S6]